MLAGAMASYQRLARPSNEATLRTHAAAGAASLRPAPPPRFKGGKRARPEHDCDDGAWEYDGAEEDEDGDGREPARGAAGQPAQPAEGGAHQKRMLRAEQNFRAQLPRWQYTQRALSPRLARHRQAQISANLALVEQLVDEFAAEPVLPTCSCGGGKGYRLLAERREVLYRGAAAGCFGMLRVPMFACAACDERQEMPACAAGCCGNTPVSGSIWFDQMLLNLHAQLTPLGVSSTNFAQALDSAARSFRSMECGVQYAPVLDDRGLSWATSAQRTAMRGLEDASQLVPEVALFTGLFGYCPVCAKVPDAPACSCQAAPAAAAGSSRTESGLSGAAIPETEQAPVEASAGTSAAEPAPSRGGAPARSASGWFLSWCQFRGRCTRYLQHLRRGQLRCEPGASGGAPANSAQLGRGGQGRPLREPRHKYHRCLGGRQAASHQLRLHRRPFLGSIDAWQILGPGSPQRFGGQRMHGTSQLLAARGSRQQHSEGCGVLRRRCVRLRGASEGRVSQLPSIRVLCHLRCSVGHCGGGSPAPRRAADRGTDAGHQLSIRAQLSSQMAVRPAGAALLRGLDALQSRPQPGLPAGVRRGVRYRPGPLHRRGDRAPLGEFQSQSWSRRTDSRRRCALEPKKS